ncbi:exopolysaccharide biosynthesis polyprenyl glycosylphosphotransferase [Lutispora saccharofermentans]|uniref:Exopolysaccharide biosynthesis polyprenyl glycosylphosphotransferase n=1 Tax=Lutispora saccharofermentans TaxID=3024236 RepID=A0ABT1NAH8_9FIRM|nr:exopolysaccharide biosynthesis polyprenyl glycosylphosphotransferase [Lutispora saccharofermentans]MCQ1528257.1 exopolysaccharide biosynthesis polyprenyl glycosylphosphotransferase [Lutispora saccharofermentans]
MFISNEVKSNEAIVIKVESEKKTLYLLFKRLMDISIAFIGFLFAFFLLIIFGTLIKLESEGPFIYSQIRVGKNGRQFKIYKLRSMYIDAEKNGPQWAQKHDARVTKIGRCIRKTRIDEIPQFINIIKGDMSIVGPRPERSCFIDEFCKEIPEYNYRLAVKPGLTGWAQVNGGYELTPQEKLKKDLYYINNQSIWLDIKIILKTVKIILSGYGAR